MAADPKVPSFKVVMVGDTGTGKSSITFRLVGRTGESPMPTIAACFFTHTVETAKGAVALELWDTAGQEQYRSVASMYYRGAAAAVVVFDVTSRDSFEGARYWVKTLQDKAPDAVVVLASNKVDLPRRRVSADEVAEFLEETGIELSFNTSATNDANTGVQDLFTALALKLAPTPEPPRAAGAAPAAAVSGRGGGGGGDGKQSVVIRGADLAKYKEKDKDVPPSRGCCG